MNITSLSPLEQKAAEAYENWVDIGDNRYGSIHREAFLYAYMLAAREAVIDLILNLEEENE